MWKPEKNQSHTNRKKKKKNLTSLAFYLVEGSAVIKFYQKSTFNPYSFLNPISATPSDHLIHYLYGLYMLPAPMIKSAPSLHIDGHETVTHVQQMYSERRFTMGVQTQQLKTFICSSPYPISLPSLGIFKL